MAGSTGIKALGGVCIVELIGALFVALILVSVISGGGADTAVANTTSPSGVTSDTTTATMPSDMIARVQANKQIYMNAAARAGIPWQIIAALHCREASCDPNRSPLSGEPIGTVNPDNTSVTTVNLQDGANLAADHIVSMAKSVYGVTLNASSSSEDIQAAFLAYNRGSMYVKGGCSVNESPYVLNNFDSAHHYMKWPTGSTLINGVPYYCEPPSTRGNINIPNGAYTTYVYLINKGI